MRFPALRILLVPLVFLGAACGSGESGGDGGEVKVVATTTHVADLVRNVGGERVTVHAIIGANADPHDFEPRPSDVGSLAEAALVFRSGGELDEWLAELVEDAGGEAETVTLIEFVATNGEHDDGEELDHGEEPDHGEGSDDGGDPDHDQGREPDQGDVDPHWWQDPRNALAAVEAIRAALTRADPGGASGYRERAAEYSDRIRRLDREIAACIERVPADKRKLVTTHDALGYYAGRYGLDVIGALIPSLSTQAQPSARDVRELVDQIRAEGAEAIFPESALGAKLERAVARETGADVGRALWADALGPEGSDGDSYLGSLASNTAALVDGLSGGEVACRPEA